MSLQRNRKNGRILGMRDEQAQGKMITSGLMEERLPEYLELIRRRFNHGGETSGSDGFFAAVGGHAG
jgi:hypothetical protein